MSPSPYAAPATNRLSWTDHNLADHTNPLHALHPDTKNSCNWRQYRPLRQAATGRLPSRALIRSRYTRAATPRNAVATDVADRSCRCDQTVHTPPPTETSRYKDWSG